MVRVTLVILVCFECVCMFLVVCFRFSLVNVLFVGLFLVSAFDMCLFRLLWCWLICRFVSLADVLLCWGRIDCGFGI